MIFPAPLLQGPQLTDGFIWKRSPIKTNHVTYKCHKSAWFPELYFSLSFYWGVAQTQIQFTYLAFGIHSGKFFTFLGAYVDKLEVKEGGVPGVSTALRLPTHLKQQKIGWKLIFCSIKIFFGLNSIFQQWLLWVSDQFSLSHSLRTQNSGISL